MWSLARTGELQASKCITDYNYAFVAIYFTDKVHHDHMYVLLLCRLINVLYHSSR